jgi:O-succinylbenzoate synthase
LVPSLAQVESNYLLNEKVIQVFVASRQEISKIETLDKVREAVKAISPKGFSFEVHSFVESSLNLNLSIELETNNREALNFTESLAHQLSFETTKALNSFSKITSEEAYEVTRKLLEGYCENHTLRLQSLELQMVLESDSYTKLVNEILFPTGHLKSIHVKPDIRISLRRTA